ncbi:MAG TPA: NAD(P)/FAD-dependent oxidoreductase [Patescibacteria group bacterium]|nr:NAD(P)/FAD-dependent oxidoreductase [Patescibacteria group bacterium]
MTGVLSDKYDAVVIGSGPNGLSGAIRLARAGLSVIVLEANETIGGGLRSAELTLPGFVHDCCSAVHPLAIGSPFLRSLKLEKNGLAWLQPQLPLAHPLEGGRAAALHRSVLATSAGLGRDQHNYQGLMAPLLSNWEKSATEFLQPILHIPDRPLMLAQFGWRSFRSAESLVKAWFKTDEARALFGGLAAHSFLPLERVPSAAFGIVLAMMGHAVGWPSPRGGSQQIANALAQLLESLSGKIVTGRRVGRLEQLPPSRVVLFDVSPRQVLSLAGNRLPGWYRRALERFHHGPGVFKIDYALSQPIPWSAEECRMAGTVHVCGSFEEVAAAERRVAQGEHPERPFVLLAQPTLFDPTRAPQGKHIAWAYCHVPQGSSVDMTTRIENQIERFAPGFRDLVLARHTADCRQLELGNANLVGGSIDGGTTDLRQLLARPVFSSAPYRIPVKGWYLCSASTPPGGGVHGMCGLHAAELALDDWFG